jgi:hypothetical protein
MSTAKKAKKTRARPYGGERALEERVLEMGALALNALLPGAQRRVLAHWCKAFLGVQELPDAGSRAPRGVDLFGAAAIYAEQLDDIGRMLVKGGVVTKKHIEQQGLRLALRDRLVDIAPRKRPKNRKAP